LKFRGGKWVTTFYTRNGDEGFTGLAGKGRLPKNDLRIETIGALDEVTASLGIARSLSQSRRSKEILLKVQRDLSSFMTELAASTAALAELELIGPAQVTWLEEQTDLLSREVDVPKEFIVPGDSQAGAALDLARTIVRRAERRLVELVHRDHLPKAELLRYINRLSSLCFLLELFENFLAGNESPTLMRKDGSA
jgi:cob(I)alamin adenosyltransferase